MKKNKNNIINIKLITTTILSGAATLLMSNVVAAQVCSYDYSDDGRTIIKEDSEACSQIIAEDVTNDYGGITFKGEVR